MPVYTRLDQIVGHTPLLRLIRTEEALELKAELYAKLEYLNPAGSVKDRAAKKMIEDAEATGKLSPGATVIEPTSGNTGIGLAALAVPKGYRVIIVMPDSMSAERRTLMSAYGAELVLTDGKSGMIGAIKKAEELAKEIPNAWIAGQFDNPANATAHYETTGPEIYADMNGKVDAFVAGIGTGGTITGTGRYLKERDPGTEVIGVEPSDSPYLTKGVAGPHPLQGIGAGFLPKVLDMTVVDRVVTVTGEDAMEAGREIAKREGVLCGISSGAALSAAIKLCQEEAYAGKRVVVLLPDTGDRYLSTALFAPQD